VNRRRRSKRERDPRSSIDDVLDVYKRDIDRTLLREAAWRPRHTARSGRPGTSTSSTRVRRRTWRASRAAGRPKDLEAIAELEILREQRDHERGG